MINKFAIVTPSFAPDFRRCQLLVNSVKKFVASSVPHYIIVDKHDENLFKKLEEGSVKIITKESILPKTIIRSPFKINKKYIWIDMKNRRLIRGWIVQQIIKMGVAKHIPSEILVYVDSDAFFIKPVNFNRMFVRDDKVRLFRESGKSDVRWDKAISKLLGLPIKECSDVNYVGHVMTWRRTNVLKLYNYLEKISNRGWIESIAKSWHFSEYKLYGHFVDNVLGAESGHYHDSYPYCHIYGWKDGKRPTFLSKEGIEKFLSDVSSDDIAIMISSSAGIPAEKYEHFLDSLN